MFLFAFGEYRPPIAPSEAMAILACGIALGVVLSWMRTLLVKQGIWTRRRLLVGGGVAAVLWFTCGVTIVCENDWTFPNRALRISVAGYEVVDFVDSAHARELRVAGNTVFGGSFIHGPFPVQLPPAPGDLSDGHWKQISPGVSEWVEDEPVPAPPAPGDPIPPTPGPTSEA